MPELPTPQASKVEIVATLWQTALLLTKVVCAVAVVSAHLMLNWAVGVVVPKELPPPSVSASRGVAGADAVDGAGAVANAAVIPEGYQKIIRALHVVFFAYFSGIYVQLAHDMATVFITLLRPRPKAVPAKPHE
jgi:hypothetical protein